MHSISVGYRDDPDASDRLLFRHSIGAAPVRWVHTNAAYRWFCRLGPDGAVLDHSTFPKNSPLRFQIGHGFLRLARRLYDRCSVLPAPQAPKSWISNFGFSIGRVAASSAPLSCEHKPLARAYCQSASIVGNFTSVESSTLWRAYRIFVPPFLGRDESWQGPELSATSCAASRCSWVMKSITPRRSRAGRKGQSRGPTSPTPRDQSDRLLRRGLLGRTMSRPTYSFVSDDGHSLEGLCCRSATMTRRHHIIHVAAEFI